MVRAIFLIPILWALAWADEAPAAVWRVPGNFSTITQALNAAGPGDVILVGPGRYRENIRWPFLDGIQLIAVEGPARTIIDGGQSGRTVAFPFNPSQTRATVLEGFTITGGFLNVAISEGAGILVSASVTIRGNHIVGNICSGSGANWGGGIEVAWGSPLIEGNLISGNEVRNGSSFNHGAGIDVRGSSSPAILNNQILANACKGGMDAGGGGVFVESSWPGTAKTIIIGNVIAGNGTSGTRGSGGGIQINYMAAGPADIVNNTIAHNACIGGGGGIEYAGRAAGRILNNIVVSNSSTHGGAVSVAGAGATVDFNDVWNNSPANFLGASAGPNGISMPPRFAGVGDYHITYKSPCVDAGMSQAPGVAVSEDPDGDPRRLDGNLDGLPGNGARIDIGADEYSHSGLSISALPKLGRVVGFDLNGPLYSAAVLAYSFSNGSLVIEPYGGFLLGFPFGVLGSGPVPLKVLVSIPGNPRLAGIRIHVQGFAGWVMGGRSVGNFSNRLDLVLH